MRLPLLALGLLLAAAVAVPAGAGELIRYRTADGSIGFVDDEKRLPPGVEVLSRTPLDPPAPKPPPAAPANAASEPPTVPLASESPATALGAPPLAAGAAVAPPPSAAGPEAPADCEALANPLDKLRCRSAHEQRCSHYGLPARCSPAELTAAQDWCARGKALRTEIARYDDEREAARDRLELCRRTGGVRPDCETDELDEAEDRVRVGERRVEALEEQCHAEGCLPGWVREACELAPEA
jgi:hypothetical protein